MSDQATKEKRRGPQGGVTTITPGGLVRKSILIHGDEEEALREKAYKDRMSESSIVREALRSYLGIEEEAEEKD